MGLLERQVCGDATAASHACAALITATLRAAQVRNPQGRIGFMVSGGRSPRGVLAQVLATPGLDWGRITLCASDERLVPLDDPASTEGMVRQVFSEAGQPLDYCSFGPDLAPAAALAQWQAALARMVWPVAVAFVGIGEDSHTASLFPNRAESGDAALWAAALPETAPHQHPRLTLGPRALLSAELVTLIATGPAKRAALDAALAPGVDPARLPAAWLAQAQRLVVFTA
jgi:6-phosphogluconolactonase